MELLCRGGKKKNRRKNGGRAGRIKRYLTDTSRDALSGVNYQLLRGEVACVDGACDVKSLQRFVACREPCGDRSRAVSDEWQTNSSLSDMQRTQHGQPGLEVKTARAVNSLGWQNEQDRARGSVCMCQKCVCTPERKNRGGGGRKSRKRAVMDLFSNYM